nr:MAG TPA: hypothetical protein [Bacteriophage sp.]
MPERAGTEKVCFYSLNQMLSSRRSGARILSLKALPKATEARFPRLGQSACSPTTRLEGRLC